MALLGIEQLAFLDGFFLNPIGLLALASLIPLIIIYLIKPKPKKQFFPSVTFLFKSPKDKAKRAILSTFFKDPLFMLQILVLLLLSAAIASPYVLVPESESVEHAVIILDASASMQTRSGFGTRFDAARDVARSSLADSNTVILVSDFPEILVDGADRREAERLISVAKPKDTSTNIYDALILADDFLPDRKGKVVVVSDFIHTTNDKDIIAARHVIESKGIFVIFRSVLNSAGNTGIVDMNIREKGTEVRLRNYGSGQFNGELRVGTASLPVTLQPGESNVFEFNTPPGITDVRLTPEDDFPADNRAFISSPEKSGRRILLITNNRGRYMYTALTLLDGVAVDVAEPPVIPEKLDYDVYVFKDVDPQKILPRTLGDVSEEVKKGKAAIIVAQDGIDRILYRDLLPLGSVSKVQARAAVLKADNMLTDGVSFGSVNEYFDGSLDVTTVAYVQKGDSSLPVIGIRKVGLGSVMYFGLMEDRSSFQFELLYPVFWKRSIDMLTGQESIRNLNFQTGKILKLDGSQPVTGPDGTVQQAKSIVLDREGIYSVGGAKIAANLLNELESDVNGANVLGEDVLAEIGKKPGGERDLPKEITFYVALLITGLVLLEVLYIKYRGDV
ncbi:MAG: VWA domain-containing protein [Candidatus Aenigmarchaeota archaeon]|nr:VWA domain-containing protein [Candidatus Aenigmarchaeota archaeon]